MKFWKNKEILVTGGAGFLGSFIVDKLIEERRTSLENIKIPRSEDMDLRIWSIMDPIIRTLC